MKADYLNPFLVSSVDVLKRMAGINATRGDIALKQALMPGHSVTVMVGVVGDVRGQVAYSMSDNVSRFVASRMVAMDRKNAKKYEAMSRSALAELANVITGNATIALAERGYKIFITPPSIISAKDATIEMVQIQTIVVPLITEMGVLEMNLALLQLAEYG